MRQSEVLKLSEDICASTRSVMPGDGERTAVHSSHSTDKADITAELFLKLAFQVYVLATPIVVILHSVGLVVFSEVM